MAHPVANADAYITRLGQGLTLTAGNGLLANDSDADGLSLTITGNTMPANGSLALNPDGSLIYMPTSGYSGADSFSYTVSDGSETNSGTVSLTVLDSPPIATTDNLSVNAGATLNIDGGVGLLSNDIDPYNAPLHVVDHSLPTVGTLSIQPDGSLIYSAPSTFVGAVYFNYTISDGAQIAFVQDKIFVHDPDHPAGTEGSVPIASPDAYYTRPGVSLVRSGASGVLLNDEQADGLPFHATSGYSQPIFGTLTIETDGAFTFMPSPGFAGHDPVQYYTISDQGGGGFFSAPIDFYVENTNPTTTTDSYAVKANHPLTANVAQGVLANDVDADNDGITIAGHTQPAHGSVTLAPDGSFTYTPNDGFIGADSFTYTATDGYTPDAQQPTALVTLEVACYRVGTHILTAAGERPIETLTIGDTVITRSGASRVKWFGHRLLNCRWHPRPSDVWPVRVCAGAFGDAMPHRDLWLSPDHAVFIDDVLIPVRYLQNGATIAQEETDHVVYWHVELERHAVILAEGLPCESYLDTGNRAAFAEPRVHRPRPASATSQSRNARTAGRSSARAGQTT